METSQLKEYQRKLLGDPENGVEPELSVEALDRASPEYAELRPYLMGEQEWPEGDVDDGAAAAAEAQAEADRIAAEEAAAAAAEPRITTTSPAIVEARDRASARETSRAAYEAKVAEHRAILREAEPDPDFDENAHRAWSKRQREANIALLDAQDEYLRVRDTEEIEVHRAVVEKSEFADTIRSIGDDFEELKLPRPYDTMVAEYNTWAGKALAESGGTDLNAAFAKFQADPEFAKKVGALPEGHEKLFIYMHAVEAQKAKGGPLDGHVLSLANREGVFRGSKQRATDAGARTIAEKNAEALNNRSTEARPATIKSGTQEPPAAPIVRPQARTAHSEGTTQEQDMAWLENYQKNILGKPRTPSQIEEHNHLRDLVMQKWITGAARPFQS